MLPLLENGFSFRDSLNLLKSRKNKSIIEKISEQLEQGSDTIQIIKSICPKEYRDNFYSFISFLPLKDSFGLAVKLYQEENQKIGGMKKLMIYPVVLFISTLAGLYVFVQMCFPLLIKLMNDFDAKNSVLESSRGILLFSIQGVAVMVLMLTFFLIVAVQKSCQIRAYCFLVKYFNLKVLKEYISAQFAYYFYHCGSVGCKTKEALSILKGIKRKPILSFLSAMIEKKLLDGKSINDALDNCYIDELLCRFMTLALYSSSMNGMMESYVRVVQERINQRIKRVTKIVQIMSYGIIGIIVIFVYQILLLPLSIMSQL